MSQGQETQVTCSRALPLQSRARFTVQHMERAALLEPTSKDQKHHLFETGAGLRIITGNTQVLDCFILYQL